MRLKGPSPAKSGTPWVRLLSNDSKSCAGSHHGLMVASPDPSQLPPRGPRDLDRPGSTRQNMQSEKRLSFLAKQIHKTAKSCFLQNITLHYLRKERNYSYFSGGPEGSLPLAGPGSGRCSSGIPRYPPPLALLPVQRPLLLERGQPGLESAEWRGRGSGSRTGVSGMAGSELGASATSTAAASTVAAASSAAGPVKEGSAMAPGAAVATGSPPATAEGAVSP
jgi:hypothetical protein